MISTLKTRLIPKAKTSMTTEHPLLTSESDDIPNGGAKSAFLKDVSKKMADVLSFVDYDTMRRLCMLLNPPDVFGNDWRMLADKMGFTFLEIRNIQQREKNPTQALLLVYKTRTGKGNKELLNDLHDYTLSMGREDCVTLLKHVLEGEDGDDLKIDMSALTCGQDSILTEQIIDASEFYYGRLCCLLLKEGTEQIREYLLNNLPYGFDNIFDVLRSKTYKMQFRLLREQEKLTQNQFNTLYPPSCAANPSVFDQELLFVLIKHLIKKNDLDWRKYPQVDKIDPEYDVIRLRHLRHRLIHKSKRDLSQNEYDQLFGEISQILLRMGQSPESIRKYSDRVPISDIPDLKQEYSKAVAQLKEEFIRATMAVDFTPTRKFNRFMILITLCFVTMIIGISMFVGIYLSNKPNGRSKCAESPVSITNKESGMFRYKSRETWGARPPISPLTRFKKPVKYVIIIHTAGLDCVEMVDCCQSVVEAQNIHMDKKNMSDIGYNFLIGNYGVVYEGRGWRFEGEHSRGWNNLSIGIAFIGDFRMRLPDKKAMQALEEILFFGIHNRYLKQKYIMYGHCQVAPYLSPGETLYNELMRWRHWKYRNVTSDAKLEGNRTSYCFDKKPPQMVAIPP
ncbi:unnamed protein product [Owenia fusiformis]|uniref:Death domain-containing protein n=1 Tax=Owenia fusiformis TaxID=6347 RepID=A0A8S4NA52_OWEFU|nr:unnamed protein product [Owenia fusiformis]